MWSAVPWPVVGGAAIFDEEAMRAGWTALGGVWTGKWMKGKTPDGAQVLYTLTSKPLSLMIRDMNKNSINPIARNLFLGISAGTPGGATRLASRNAVTQWMASQGIPTEGFLIDNGSGLSRTARISTDQLTGVLLAAPPIDFHVSDTYFVVAHFHYVLYGTIVFATFAGIYFWFPKITGRMMDERLGKLHFWLTFIGFHGTFLVQHWLGNEGMPRRYADYLASDGFTTLNTISTIGAFILGASMLPFIYNVFKSYRYGEVVTVDDPWGYGNSLEWATSCPPPRHNFTELPRIRSERPAFELHYPHVAERMRLEGHVGLTGKPIAHAAPSEEAAQAVVPSEQGGDRDPKEK